MPSRAERKRICIIGDSLMASVREAEKAGLLNLPPCDIEYWGATGPRFRGMFLKNDRIEVRGAEAKEAFARVNGTGRTSVGADEFDAYLFFGCRVDSHIFFGAHLQRLYGDGGWQSRAALHLSARGFLVSSRAFRIAAIFASEHGARVSFAPTPFLTAGTGDHSAKGQTLDLYPDAVGATPEDRAWLWQALSGAAESYGVELIEQPEHTVTDGVFTDFSYAIAGAEESGDYVHKSPAFSAEMLKGWTRSIAAGDPGAVA